MQSTAQTEHRVGTALPGETVSFCHRSKRLPNHVSSAQQVNLDRPVRLAQRERVDREEFLGFLEVTARRESTAWLDLKGQLDGQAG